MAWRVCRNSRQDQARAGSAGFSLPPAIQVEPWAFEDIVVKRFMIAFLMTSVLVLSTGAQEKGNAQSTNSAMLRSQEKPPNSSVMRRPMQTQVPPASHDAQSHSQPDGTGAGTIAVDVWSSATSTLAESDESQSAKLTQDFAVAALNAAFGMQSTERRLENTIKRGFPLYEFWIQTDLNGIDDSLKLAALSIKNDADRKALQQLENQSNRLRLWSDWLIDANRNVRLGEYYMSASALDNDERFQNSVACTKFLVSMLTSRMLAEDDSCW